MASRSRDTLQTITYLRRAVDLAPFDHNIRKSEAYFYTVVRQHALRRAAIKSIEGHLRVDPFAIDLLVPLMAYQLADNDTAGADRTEQRLKRLWPQGTVTRH